MIDNVVSWTIVAGVLGAQLRFLVSHIDGANDTCSRHTCLKLCFSIAWTSVKNNQLLTHIATQNNDDVEFCAK